MLYKFDADDKLIDEIVTLRQNGESISFHNIPTKWKNENGEEIALTDEQKIEFEEILSTVNDAFKDIQFDSNYQTLSYAGKAKVLNKINDIYYEIAKYEVLGVNLSTKLAKLIYNTSKNKNISKYIPVLVMLQIELENVKENKKQEAIKYLNEITSLTRNEKMLVAYLLGYSISEDNFDSVASFLTRLGMSYNNAIAYLV